MAGTGNRLLAGQAGGAAAALPRLRRWGVDEPGLHRRDAGNRHDGALDCGVRLLRGVGAGALQGHQKMDRARFDAELHELEARALYQVGLELVINRQYTEAKAVFQRIEQEYGDTPVAADAARQLQDLALLETRRRGLQNPASAARAAVPVAGAKLPEGQVEGRDLLPLVEKPGSDWPDRYLFTHKGRWKTGADPDDHQWNGFAVRNQQYRFVDNNSLYDMQKDPSQTTNIFEEHPQIVKQMQAVYDSWWKETRPRMVNETAPMSPVRPFHVLYEQQMKSGGIPEWVPPEL